MIETGIGYYARSLNLVLRHRVLTIGVGFGALALTVVLMGPILRREFFPEVDAGAFEMYVRARSGTRIELTERWIQQVEDFVREHIEAEDLQLILSEIGVTPDWSAAYTPNAGPMDAVVKVQLSAERHHSAQEYVHRLREAFRSHSRFSNNLEFAFDAGGMVRAAMNEGKSTPISIRVTGKDQKLAHQIATAIKNEVKGISGVVDPRVLQRPDYPQYRLTVDRQKASDLGLTQAIVMQNVVAAFNSSISFNKHNFWIDPKTNNQYFVGVQYPEADIKSIETLLDIPITTHRPDLPKRPIPLRNIVTLTREAVPTEVTHYQIQPTIEVSLGVHGRDLGHVSDDVARVLNEFGAPDAEESGNWRPWDPTSREKRPLIGSKIVLSGEYLRMQDTFNSLFRSLILAALLIYFLMVGLDRSFLVPLSVMSIVPICLIGIMLMLYVTGSAVNVQSLLGFIFVIGVQVANSVLMTDYAQELRRHEGLAPIDAIRQAARLRVRPITMTALAALFALVPGALAIERGSEANAPLARAIIGGLLAGEPATLFVLPSIYSLIVRDSPGDIRRRRARQDADLGAEGAEDPPMPEGGWEEEPVIT
jgi:multidrug efflux pump subunit AcrB